MLLMLTITCPGREFEAKDEETLFDEDRYLIS